MTNAPAFMAWLDRFFATYYRRNPVNATFIGVHEYDDRLPDCSEVALGDALADQHRLLAELPKLPDEQLTTAERIDRELAAGALEIAGWELRSGHFQRGDPGYATGEAAFGLLGLFLREFAPLPDRVTSAIARLNELPLLLAQSRLLIPNAPPAWTEHAIRDCDGMLMFLTDGVDRLIAAHPELGSNGEQFQRAAERALGAVAGHRDYLADRLSSRSRDDVACGEEALDLLLRQGHCLPWDAATLERYAEDRLAEAEVRLGELAVALNEPDWRRAMVKLAAIHPSADHYYARYQEIWDAHRAAAIEHHLLSWPDYPIRYVPRPDWVRSAAPYLYFLFYRAPAAFDPVSVVDYLVEPLDPDMPEAEQQRILQSTNDSVITLNHVIHHGGIGHHLQNWHAYRSASRIGRIAAVDGASRIALFCGGTMAEGWACYATGLMDEIGFLTPLEQLSEQYSWVRMAARAIVDLRLHTGRLSLSEAASFYQAHTAMSPQAAQAEAVKNSRFPGTGLMYLAGTDQIRDLRHDLEVREGAAFDLAAFHDRFLAYGSIPVALVAREMLGPQDT